MAVELKHRQCHGNTNTWISCNQHAKVSVEGPTMWGCSNRRVLCQAVVLLVCLLGMWIVSVNGARLGTSILRSKHRDQPQETFPSDGSALDFFGVDDALQVTWYHGANSLDQMQEALEGDYQMLEGDIILRWYGFPNQTDEPVMAHPPEYNSDNTLDNWLDSILARSDKGPKLDFKGEDVIEPSLKVLQSKAAKVSHPVWANADVVRGPNSVSRPIDSDVFLGLVNQYFPAMTLSLGWKTGCCTLQNPFTRSMMDEMWDIVKDIPQPVTFPARASLFKDSWTQFKYLLEKDPSRFTITVWTGAGQVDWEGASPYDLLYARNDCDKRLIYYDLPGTKFQEFKQLCVTAGSPLNHFSLPAGRDALQVTWAHGVNSKAELDEALSGDVMMLEADVTLHGYGTANQTNTPIMAHPPDIYSDLTLEEWIERVVNTSRGVKLDFKFIEVLEPAMTILKRYKDQYQQPIWLNSDIFHGPNSRLNQIPVNATEFRRIVLEHFPESTWSIGWTTSEPGLEIYSREMVEEMHEYARDLDQPITFPIRASMLYDSWENLRWLLEQSRGYTLTVWSGSDNVDPDHLVHVRNDYEIDRIYYDLPDWLMEDFLNRLKQTTDTAPTTNDGTSGAFHIRGLDWFYTMLCVLSAFYCKLTL